MVPVALKLTRQEWAKLSLDENGCEISAATDLDVLVEHVTALLLIRIVACVATPGMFPDMSTSMICVTCMGRTGTSWPKQVSDKVVQQLAVFVRRMLSGYKNVQYHNFQHAYHVVLSVNKLLDMMACCYTNLDESEVAPRKFRPPPSFGLRNEPLAMFALVFAALIHDVEHQGIPNRQLAAENDRLAVLYNDQSIAENWSLYIAFSEFLQDEFVDLRMVLFGPDLESSSHAEEYHNFRKMVINMVLSTDIASPERTQVGKSKWKEAFGDTHEAVEAKLLLRSNSNRFSTYSYDSNESSVGVVAVHQNSASSDFSSSNRNNNNSVQGRQVRRLGQESTVSDVTNSVGRRGSGETTLDELEEFEQNNSSAFACVDEVDNDSVTPENSRSGDDDGAPLIQLTRDGKAGVDSLEHHFKATKRLSQSSNLAPTSDHLSMYLSVSASSDHPRLTGKVDDKSTPALNQFLSKSHHRFESRMHRSATANSSKHYRQRLGILRTVDLGGETLQTYSRHDRGYTSSQSTIAYSVADAEMDEPDELKMTVVMETLMAAADVAHNLQSWSHLLAWSKRLYFELRHAHVIGRGADVSENWFENQIGFLESYVLPLARRLEDTGVFGDEGTLPGFHFAQRVEELRDEWISKGDEFSQELIKEAAQRYPIGNSGGGTNSSNNSSGSCGSSSSKKGS